MEDLDIKNKKSVNKPNNSVNGEKEKAKCD
jgi:hypothetical protein